MRIVKEAEERRNEILDESEKLFVKKGFNGTSTNDILESVGIARGTLYYHFKSKEDIMDALIERYNSKIISLARKIADDKKAPVFERIFRVILSIKIQDEDSKQVIEHIHKPQNALMHQKIIKMLIESLTPIFTDIIDDGIKQGLFATPYPYECMEMIVTYANIAFDSDVIDMDKKNREKKMEAMFFNIERLLKAEEGSFASVINFIDSGKENNNE